MTATSNKSALAAMAADPAAYRQRLVIDTGGRHEPLASVCNDWQRNDFTALDGGWLTAVGCKPEGNVFSRGYLERGRGHSKTSDLAVMAAWALAFSQRTIMGAAAAASRDQARLMRNAIERVVRSHKWLSSRLTIQDYRVVNRKTGSTLDILAADYNTSWGLLVDFLLIDELTHWPAAGERLWDSLASAVAKRPGCMFVIISNAGLGQGSSWQWKIRETCRTSDDWYFSRLDGPVATWITPDLLNEQKRLLPDSDYRRLWLNQWTSAVGDAVSIEDIEGCTTQVGPMPGYMPEFGPYIDGLDLGLKNDRSAFCVVACDVPKQQIRLAHCESWSPEQFGGTVSIEAVRQGVVAAHKRFGLSHVFFDPWQAMHLAERLADNGILMCEWPFTPKNMSRMATELMRALRNRTLILYDDKGLHDDLSRLSIVETQAGFKLVAARTKAGHADRAMSLAMALPFAVDVSRDLMLYPPRPQEIEYVEAV